MQLNTIKPAAGAKHAKKRVGRGIGSGTGKTAGLGHKGQHARAGGFHKTGFEGGQMPLQRRLPKRGFISLKRDDTAEVRLSDLNRLKADTIDLAVLKAAGIVPIHAISAKVIVSGELSRKVALRGLRASKGARAAIEAAGGSLEEVVVKPSVNVGKGKKAAARSAGIARAESRSAVTSETIAKERVAAEAEAEAKGEAKAAKKAATKSEKKSDSSGDEKAAKPKPAAAKKAKKGE